MKKETIEQIETAKAKRFADAWKPKRVGEGTFRHMMIAYGRERAAEALRDAEFALKMQGNASDATEQKLAAAKACIMELESDERRCIDARLDAAERQLAESKRQYDHACDAQARMIRAAENKAAALQVELEEVRKAVGYHDTDGACACLSCDLAKAERELAEERRQRANLQQDYLAMVDKRDEVEAELERVKAVAANVGPLVMDLDAERGKVERMQKALETISAWGASVKKLEEAEGLDAVLLLCAAALSTAPSVSDEPRKAVKRGKP